MKAKYIVLLLLCMSTAVAAQDNNNKHEPINNKHDHAEDSTDVFFRHLNLNEVTVTGVTGDTKLKLATAPVSIISPQVLRATASTNIYRADDTETETPGYALLSLSAGTDIQVKGKKIAELYVSADNLLNTAYQNHLSRLKYADMNVVTGRQGVYNMGRNITFKVVVPIAL